MQPKRKTSSLARSSKSGFTLIEIMTVIAVIGILSAVSVPAVNSLISASGASNSTVQLATTLEQAHQYATSHNTYVYVSLCQEVSSSNEPELVVALASSNDGTEISKNRSTSFLVGPNEKDSQLISKVLRLKGFVTRPVGAVSDEVIPRPNPADSEDVGLASGSSDTTPSIKFGNNTYPISFWFAPDGTASRDGVFPTRLEFVVLPENKSDKWASAIQIAGLTGSVKVYRAN